MSVIKACIVFVSVLYLQVNLYKVLRKTILRVRPLLIWLVNFYLQLLKVQNHAVWQFMPVTQAIIISQLLILVMLFLQSA